MPRPLKLQVTLRRKQDDLPVYVTIPAAKIEPWGLEATTTVEARFAGVDLGRRSLVLHRGSWFLELRREHLEAAGKAVGQRGTLELALASTVLPAELAALIEGDAAARANWEGRTDAQRRALREHVLEAKGAATRERRARRALLAAPRPAQPEVAGLGAEPVPVSLRVVARDLPGVACGPYRAIRVGMPAKKGGDVGAVFDADDEGAHWETTIEVLRKSGRTDFKGPAVHGPAGQRFLYLCWTGRKGRAAAALFRRAKLRLDEVPPGVLAEALRSGTLACSVSLRDPEGMPACASLRPPAITWASR